MSRLWQLLGVDARALAMLRIAYATILLVDLLRRAPEMSFWMGPDGFYPVEVARGALLFVVGIHSLTDAMWFQWLLVGIAGLAACSLLVGFWSRSSALLSWYLLLSLHLRNTNMVDVGDHALLLCLFWLIFLPSGSRWGLDARSARVRGEQPSRRVESVASAGLLVQIASIIFVSSLFKMQGESWAAGTAVRLALSDDVWVRPFGVWLLGFPDFTRLVTWATLAIEFFGPPILLFAPRRWQQYVRVPILFGLLCFFAGIGSGINLGLIPFIMASSLLAFLPTELLDRVLGRAEGRDLQPRTDRLSQRLVDVAMPGFMLGLVLLLNAGALLPRPLISGRLEHLFWALQLSQGWSMYAPDPKIGSFRFVFMAGLPSGELKSVALGGERPGWPAMPTEPALERIWNDYRMKMHVQDRITLPPQPRAIQSLGRWFCRHSSLRPTRVQIQKIARRTRLAEPDAEIRSVVGTTTPLPFLDCPPPATSQRSKDGDDAQAGRSEGRG